MANAVNLSQVGDVILHLGSTPPAGYLSLGEGTSLSRTTYAELWAWAQQNTNVLTETAWQSAVNSQGSCAYFSSGDGSTTFRLPKIQSILKANTSGTVGAFTKAVYNNIHFHGLGKMDNNNGTWGKYAYSDATYPTGTAGYFWNGKGGHSDEASPDYAGDVITSNNMVSASGSAGTVTPTPATTNLMLCIRYTLDHQATATILDGSAALAAVNELTDAVSSSGNISPELVNFEETGGILYAWGELRQWGYVADSEAAGEIVFPIAFATAPANISFTVEDPDEALTSPVLVVSTAVSETTVAYKVLGLEEQNVANVRIRWQALGRA